MSASKPAGARFYRCALQVNPGDYAGTFRGQEALGDARDYAEAVVARAVDIGISVLAITNHNDVNGIPAFRHAAANRDITIFPGFELSSSEGIHVLCIYPPEIPEAKLERYLGRFGIDDSKPSSTLSDHSFEQILVRVRKQGGITIAAHATNAKGLLKVLTGEARMQAWSSQALLAIQIPGSVDDLPQGVREIVENRNPSYRRDPPADRNLAVAVVNAKDVAEPEQLADPSATCFIQMSEPSIDGLRQAFLDPGSRIRLNSDTPPEAHAELVSLAWEGGFLDGVEVRFNPNLNVLIGGRGTGKSTVIESLRYVLGLDPLGEEAYKSHIGIVQRVLRGGTKISVLVRSQRSHSPATHEYRIERTVPNPPVVREAAGRISNLNPKDILPGIEVYGQHEISELTRSPERLTRLLDRFLERDPSLAPRKAALRRDLQKTRRTILDSDADLQQTEEGLAGLEGLEETLQRFKEAGLEDRLSEQSLLVSEEHILGSVPERLQAFRDALSLLAQEAPIDRTFLSPRALGGLPGRKILAGLNDVLGRLSTEVEAAARRLEVALKQADEEIAEIRSQWGGRRREVEADYQRILRELQESAVDGEEFMRLREEIERLRPLREILPALRASKDEQISRRRALLVEWEDLKAKEFQRLARAAKEVGKKLPHRVEVKVTAAGNREPLVQLLREEIGGRLSEAIKVLSASESISLPELVARCRGGPDAIREMYAGIPPAQASQLAEASSDVLMRIEELELAPTTEIRLNTAPAEGPASWRALDQLSTGQKATAVLLLLLLESEAPLIVDQPEDDLDNRFITEGVVPRMREEKQRRQFIFATHNANLPVLGGAELILGLTAAGEAGAGQATIAPEHSGSIDTPSVRELVEDLLEGGKEAFETRRLRYGF